VSDWRHSSAISVGADSNERSSARDRTIAITHHDCRHRRQHQTRLIE